VGGPHLFDVATDPHEENNLWATVDPASMRVVMRTIRASFHLSRIYNEVRMGN
jgi:hypothetical protein